MGGEGGGESMKGTIVLSTVGRPEYAFDVFGLSLPANFLGGGDAGKLKEAERRLTDGKSVNLNGNLVEGVAKEKVLEWIKKSCGGPADAASSADDMDLLVHVTERDGSLRIAVSAFSDKQKSSSSMLSKSILGETSGPYLQDHPQVGGDRIVFTSTEQKSGNERESWTAVYSSTFLTAPAVDRLTPEGVTDYSPSISPSGKWVVAASLQGKGWQGDVEELPTDLYVFDAADGSKRRLVMKNAGWPSWADESTLYYHRIAADGWWSVFRVILPEGFLATGKGVVEDECRVTPPGVHAFTPSASRTGDWVAVATRRPSSKVRHVEVFDMRSNTFIKLTEKISPNANHYNPFVSPSSSKIVYHRCRGASLVCGKVPLIPRLEPLRSPIPGLALVRAEGTFPAFSHHHAPLVAYAPDARDVVVTSLRGEGKRKVFSGSAFGIAWDWKREGVVYTSSGPIFAPESTTVHIIAILDAHLEPSLTGNQESSLGEAEYKILTKEGTGNNAFPSPSPDGKHVVFRSGRSGHKNLYIMDAVHGEKAEIRQLTDGAWTDTMPNWSPTGEWIAFSSNRLNPDAGHFAGYLIHPDGSGLHRILGHDGRVNHLTFSPDGQHLAFTSDFAGISAEPISLPNQFQPYGEIYLSSIDGSGARRLTHNAYEDGTPCWGPAFVDVSDLSPELGDPVSCGFDDDLWLATKQKEDEEAKKMPVICCPYRKTTY